MVCARCRREFPEDDAGRCPICGAPIPKPVSERTSGPDWERRDSYLDFAAIFGTIKGVLTEPSRTFSTMRTEGDLASPLVFGVVLGTIGAVFNLIWQSTFQQSIFSRLPIEMTDQMKIAAGGTVAKVVVGMILSPVVVTIGLFLVSGIYHVALMILGAATQGYEATFRAVAYTFGSTALFNVLPICGGIVGGIWGLVAVVIGLKEIQRTSTGRAAGAVLLPAVACCACGAIAAAMMGGAANLLGTPR